MILERVILKIFNPRKLAHRDGRRVYEAFTADVGEYIRGEHLSYMTYIPGHDLGWLLVKLENEGFIARYPDAGDVLIGTDPMEAWWRPAERFAELGNLFGAVR